MQLPEFRTQKPYTNAAVRQLLVGAPFCGALVRLNMMNMRKSDPIRWAEAFSDYFNTN